MGLIESVFRRFFPKKEEKIELSTFNVLGLDPAADVTDCQKLEMNELVEEFNIFLVGIDKLHGQYLERTLYGGMGKERAEQILSRYKTVQEGYEHISGRFSEGEDMLHKRKYLINPILVKMGELKKCGEEKKIYSSDFIQLKKKMLEMLMREFGSGLDIPDFEIAIEELKKIDMIPKEYGFDEMVRYCALGRWY